MARVNAFRPPCLETAATKAPGGTGVANDWSFVRELNSSGGFDNLPSIIAAGGLTPETVAAVVRDICPWALRFDIAGGAIPRRPSQCRICATRLCRKTQDAKDEIGRIASEIV